MGCSIGGTILQQSQHIRHGRKTRPFAHGSKLATASWDGTARLWDAATGKPLSVYRGHNGPLTSVEFSSDGQRIVTASLDKTARIFDVPSGKAGRSLRTSGGLQKARFSPSGRFIATASSDGSARLWDSRTGAQIAHFQGPSGRVKDIVFSPDEKQVISTSDDQIARVWDISAVAQGSVFQIVCSQLPDRKLNSLTTGIGLKELHPFALARNRCRMQISYRTPLSSTAAIKE